MSKKLVSADDLHTKWMKESKYRKAYEALEEEFRLAQALKKRTPARVSPRKSSPNA